MRNVRQVVCLVIGHRWLLFQAGEATHEQCRRCSLRRPLRWRDFVATLAKRG
jgi:hypothetical protein